MAKSKAAAAPRGTRARSRNSLGQADKIMRDYRRRPALMTKEVMFELDAAIMKDTFAVSRRMALVLLTEPCGELIKKLGDDRDFAVAVASLLDVLSTYKGCLRDLETWIDEADKRIRVGLATREDMDQVLVEARASNAGGGGSAEVAP